MSLGEGGRKRDRDKENRTNSVRRGKRGDDVETEQLHEETFCTQTGTVKTKARKTSGEK